MMCTVYGGLSLHPQTRKYAMQALHEYANIAHIGQVMFEIIQILYFIKFL